MGAPGSEKESFLKLLNERGFRNQELLKAIAAVPWESFISRDISEFGYDALLSPEEDQTRFQPYAIALMIEALCLTPNQVVLEVGTGSGYSTAILSRVTRKVYSISRHQNLADQASARLNALNYTNVEVRSGDATLGWPKKSPYDAILVMVGGPKTPQSLIEQLRIGGKLLIPADPSLSSHELLRITRTGKEEVKVKVLALAHPGPSKRGM